MSIDSHIDNYKKLIQELQHKITVMENDQKAQASQPRFSDLTVWKDKIRALYSQKKNYHQEILTLESKEKLLRWKMKYKSNNAERISAFDDRNNEVYVLFMELLF